MLPAIVAAAAAAAPSAALLALLLALGAAVLAVVLWETQAVLIAATAWARRRLAALQRVEPAADGSGGGQAAFSLTTTRHGARRCCFRFERGLALSTTSRDVLRAPPLCPPPITLCVACARTHADLRTHKSTPRAGVLLRGFDLDAAALPAWGGPFAVTRLRVPEAEVRWAGLGRPLHLRVAGARLELLQRQAPEPRGPEALARARGGRGGDPQLALLDQLLWRGAAGGLSRRRWAGALRAVVRGGLNLALRLVRVEAADLAVQYAQEGDVGPWCVGQPALAADALRVYVRSARFEPAASRRRGGSGGANGDAGPEAAGAAAGGSRPGSPLRVIGARTDAGGVGGGSGEAGLREVAAAPQASSTLLVEGVSASLLTKRWADAVRAAGGAGGGAPDGVPPAGRSAAPAQVPRAPRIGWDEWDAEHVVLRQWFAHVDISVSRRDAADAASGNQQQQGGGAGRGAPPAAAAAPTVRPQSPPMKRRSPVRGQHEQQQQQSAQADQQRQPPPPAFSLVVHALGSAAAPRARASNSSSTTSSGAGRGSSSAAAASSGAPLVSVSVSLKSCMLEASPEAAAVFLRLVNRLSAYARFARLWRARPQQPVARAPALWWQHAGRAVLAECRARLPVRSASLALERRREYLRLYRAVHAPAAARDHLFALAAAAGGGAGGGAGPAAGGAPPLTEAAARARLRDLEAAMTPSQASVYRVFAAARHSAHLAAHPGLRAQWLEALDALGSFLDLVPTQGAAKDDWLLGAQRGLPVGHSLCVSV